MGLGLYGYRALARKIKLMTFSLNREIRLVLTNGRTTMIGSTKKVFITTRRTLGNAILGNKYFRASHYTTHKPPLRNVFLFVYHKLDSDMEYK